MGDHIYIRLLQLRSRWSLVRPPDCKRHIVENQLYFAKTRITKYLSCMLSVFGSFCHFRSSCAFCFVCVCFVLMPLDEQCQYTLWANKNNNKNIKKENLIDHRKRRQQDVPVVDSQQLWCPVLTPSPNPNCCFVRPAQNSSEPTVHSSRLACSSLEWSASKHCRQIHVFRKDPL